MKGFGLLVLFFVIGAALICFCFSNKPITSSYSISGMGFHGSGSHVYVKATNRKLKEEENYSMNETDSIELEDYRPVDPAPSSKASIKPGPIQHGTPLLPFIPKPSPPPLAPGPPSFP